MAMKKILEDFQLLTDLRSQPHPTIQKSNQCVLQQGKCPSLPDIPGCKLRTTPNTCCHRFRETRLQSRTSPRSVKALLTRFSFNCSVLVVAPQFQPKASLTVCQEASPFAIFDCHWGSFRHWLSVGRFGQKTLSMPADLSRDFLDGLGPFQQNRP